MEKIMEDKEHPIHMCGLEPDDCPYRIPYNMKEHDRMVRSDAIDEIFYSIKKRLKKCYPSWYSTKPMEESEYLMSYKSFCLILDEVEEQLNEQKNDEMLKGE